MNNYYVVATAKHTLNLRGKQYKIGEAVPTELTEKEYEFYKDALNVESVTQVKNDRGAFVDLLNSEVKDLEKELLKKQLKEAQRRIDELEQQSQIVATVNKEFAAETEVKPKRPYSKKETK